MQYKLYEFFQYAVTYMSNPWWKILWLVYSPVKMVPLRNINQNWIYATFYILLLLSRCNTNIAKIVSPEVQYFFRCTIRFRNKIFIVVHKNRDQIKHVSHTDEKLERVQCKHKFLRLSPNVLSLFKRLDLKLYLHICFLAETWKLHCRYCQISCQMKYVKILRMDKYKFHKNSRYIEYLFVHLQCDSYLYLIIVLTQNIHWITKFY